MKQRYFVLCVCLGLMAGTAKADDRIRVVDEGGISDEWTLAANAQLAAPAYPAIYAAHPVEACVAIGYLLGADGATSDFALLKSWSADEPERGVGDYWAALSGAATQALAQWRFVPRPEIDTPRPVYTVATFIFGSAAAMETRKHCGIPQLSRRLMELRSDERARRLMDAKGIFSRLEIDPMFEERYRSGQAMQQRRDDAARFSTPPPAPPAPPPPSPPPSPPPRP